MIRPKNQHVTTILIHYVHERNGHCGVEQVLTLLREQLWVVKGREAVKEVIGRCISRTKRMTPRMTQEMAELLKIRLTPYEPPFTYSGVNYHKILKISPPKINIYKPPKPVTQNPLLNRPSKYKPPVGMYLENCPPAVGENINTPLFIIISTALG